MYHSILISKIFAATSTGYRQHVIVHGLLHSVRWGFRFFHFWISITPTVSPGPWRAQRHVTSCITFRPTIHIMFRGLHYHGCVGLWWQWRRVGGNAPHGRAPVTRCSSRGMYKSRQWNKIRNQMQYPWRRIFCGCARGVPVINLAVNIRLLTGPTSNGLGHARRLRGLQQLVAVELSVWQQFLGLRSTLSPQSAEWTVGLDFWMPRQQLSLLQEEYRIMKRLLPDQVSFPKRRFIAPVPYDLGAPPLRW